MPLNKENKPSFFYQRILLIDSKTTSAVHLAKQNEVSLILTKCSWKRDQTLKFSLCNKGQNKKKFSFALRRYLIWQGWFSLQRRTKQKKIILIRSLKIFSWLGWLFDWLVDLTAYQLPMGYLMPYLINV